MIDGHRKHGSISWLSDDGEIHTWCPDDELYVSCGTYDRHGKIDPKAATTRIMRRETPPIIKGGQGRDAQETIERGWRNLELVCVLGVIVLIIVGLAFL